MSLESRGLLSALPQSKKILGQLCDHSSTISLPRDSPNRRGYVHSTWTGTKKSRVSY